MAVMAEDCTRNEVWKKSASQVANKFDELADHYVRLYEHEKPKIHDTFNNLIMNIPHMELLSMMSPGIVKQ